MSDYFRPEYRDDIAAIQILATLRDGVMAVAAPIGGHIGQPGWNILSAAAHHLAQHFCSANGEQSVSFFTVEKSANCCGAIT
jgi:hypothetical protein